MAPKKGKMSASMTGQLDTYSNTALGRWFSHTLAVGNDNRQMDELDFGSSAQDIKSSDKTLQAAFP